MTINDIRRGVSENYNTLTFVYAGKPSGVEPSAHNSIVTFEAWHGDEAKEYKDIDTLLNDKFYSGKSIADLVGHVNFEFC